MASRAVEILLGVTDAAPGLVRTGEAAEDAGQQLVILEDAAEAARRELLRLVSDARKVDRARYDLERLAKAGHDVGDALSLVSRARGIDARDIIKGLPDVTDDLQGLNDRAGDVDFGAIRSGAEKVFGPLLGDILDVGGALGALGPIAGGVAAGLVAIAIEGAALAAVVTGIVSAVNASQEWLETLDEIGAADFVTDEQRQQSEAAAIAFEALSAASQGLGLAFASLFSDEVTDDLIVLTGALVKLREAFLEAEIAGALFGASTAAAGGIARTAATSAFGPVVGGLVGGAVEGGLNNAADLGPVQSMIEEFRKAGEEIADGIRASRLTLHETEQAVLSFADIQFGRGTFTDDKTKAPDTREADAAFKRALADYAQARDRLDAMTLNAARAEDALGTAYQQTVAEVRELVDVTGEAEQGLRVLDMAFADFVAGLDAAARETAEAAERAREAAKQQFAGDVDKAVSALGGDLSPLLGGMGPAGAIGVSLMRLTPEAVDGFGEALSGLGDVILSLPESIAKALASVLGFGADSTGQGVGRGVGAIGGAVLGGLLLGPAGALLGGVVGSAAGGQVGGAYGDALSARAGMERGRSPTERAAQRRGRRPLVVNAGIVSHEFTRTIDRTMTQRSGVRGLGLGYGGAS